MMQDWMRCLLRGVMLFWAIAATDRTLAEDWSWALGAGLAAVERENSGFDETLRYAQGVLQIGAHKNLSEQWRLGSRLDWVIERSNKPDGEPGLLMWRMIDVDWRLADAWALNAGFGFARFSREQPAYGYGLGVGLKYQLGKRSYLAVDLASVESDISTGVPGNGELSPKDQLDVLTIVLATMF